MQSLTNQITSNLKDHMDFTQHSNKNLEERVLEAEEKVGQLEKQIQNNVNETKKLVLNIVRVLLDSY